MSSSTATDSCVVSADSGDQLDVYVAQDLWGYYGESSAAAFVDGVEVFSWDATSDYGAYVAGYYGYTGVNASLADSLLADDYIVSTVWSDADETTCGTDPQDEDDTPTDTDGDNLCDDIQDDDNDDEDDEEE